ncbi:MAG: STAS/SEC14 domain-containing protein [Kofleriaceae bacterium]
MTERAQAATWLASLPEGSAAKVRLVDEKAVLVFDVTEALRVADFDALTATADSWIETHGELRGLVVHVRAFPGWESLTAMVRHVRFVRDHHRKIGRIALATDIKLAAIAHGLAETFIAAEVRAFGYDELEQAIAWAASTDAHA